MWEYVQKCLPTRDLREIGWWNNYSQDDGEQVGLVPTWGGTLYANGPSSYALYITDKVKYKYLIRKIGICILVSISLCSNAKSLEQNGFYRRLTLPNDIS